MSRIVVTHATTYRYAWPVLLHDHRLMIRPRDSHDLRLISAGLTTSPPSRGIRWFHDVFGNSVAVLSFERETDQLEITSRLTVETYGPSLEQPQIADHAKAYPFGYSREEQLDLGSLSDRQYDDPEGRLANWVRDMFATMAAESGTVETLGLLRGLNQHIHSRLTYQRRDAHGTQTPHETLSFGGGSCRDYALLFMECARQLGFAAKFVTGYLVDQRLVSGEQTMVGGGATHAWAQIYIPGLGWVEFDPTNNTVGSSLLIRVAVTRDPSQAVPISGSFTGPGGVATELSVNVTTAVDEALVAA
jgi:transglutaminase-like putative cysteine protease